MFMTNHHWQTLGLKILQWRRSVLFRWTHPKARDSPSDSSDTLAVLQLTVILYVVIPSCTSIWSTKRSRQQPHDLSTFPYCFDMHNLLATTLLSSFVFCWLLYELDLTLFTKCYLRDITHTWKAVLSLELLGWWRKASQPLRCFRIIPPEWW